MGVLHPLNAIRETIHVRVDFSAPPVPLLGRLSGTSFMVWDIISQPRQLAGPVQKHPVIDANTNCMPSRALNLHPMTSLESFALSLAESRKHDRWMSRLNLAPHAFDIHPQHAPPLKAEKPQSILFAFSLAPGPVCGSLCKSW
jgi:hypothetical protein